MGWCVLHPVREVNSFLALVCLLRADNMKRRGLIDYNINCFKEALTKVTKVLGRASEPAGPRRPGSSRGAATRARRGGGSGDRDTRATGGTAERCPRRV